MKLRTWTALWTLYLVWGSTYLGIKVMVETMPPFLSERLSWNALLGAALIVGSVFAVVRRETALPAEEGAREPALEPAA